MKTFNEIKEYLEKKFNDLRKKIKEQMQCFTKETESIKRTKQKF